MSSAPRIYDRHDNMDSRVRERSRPSSDALLAGELGIALRPTDSWIDIASSAISTSAISTIPAQRSTRQVPADRQPSTQRSTQGAQIAEHLQLLFDRRPSTDCSSQDEYEESESESDKVMTSSNEYTPHHLESSEDRGEGSRKKFDSGLTLNIERNTNSAAFEAANVQCFTPQPNAFSHSSSSHIRPNDAVPGSYFPPTRPTIRPSTTRTSHPSHNFLSPSHRPDHDAALRASLSTLLSCAAAARGLPKRQSSSPPTFHNESGRVQIGSLRIVSEDEIMREEDSSLPLRPERNKKSASSSGRQPGDFQEKVKRRASRSRSRERTLAKKARQIDISDTVAPTLLTWTTAVGVVMLVTALSFSTGFVLGKESGKLEAASGAHSQALSIDICGNASGRGMNLKRLRWSSTPSVVA